MLNEKLTEAIEWYETKVCSCDFDIDIYQQWGKLHARMWRSWLDKMGIPQLMHGKTIRFGMGEDELSYIPDIIVPALELEYSSQQMRDCYYEYMRAEEPFQTTVPLFISFDAFSSTYDKAAAEEMSPDGFAIINNPALPFQKCGNSYFETEELEGVELCFKLGKFDKELVYVGRSLIDKTFLCSVTEERTPLESRFKAGLFGKLFLVGENELLQNQESRTGSFRFDLGRKVANEVILEFYEIEKCQ